MPGFKKRETIFGVVLSISVASFIFSKLYNNIYLELIFKTYLESIIYIYNFFLIYGFFGQDFFEWIFFFTFFCSIKPCVQLHVEPSLYSGSSFIVCSVSDFLLTIAFFSHDLLLNSNFLDIVR